MRVKFDKVKFDNIFSDDSFWGFIMLIIFLAFIIPQSYNNFIDHRNIFPRPDPKEYIYVCPNCRYATKDTHKYCPECHKLVHYNQIKTELKH